jgi:hypothetical protein
MTAWINGLFEESEVASSDPSFLLMIERNIIN